MQCPNCQFENMPGTATCARCGTSMTLQEQAVDVRPPRAGRWGKRFQRVRMAGHCFGEGTGRVISAVAPRIGPVSHTPMDNFRPQVVFRCAVPGWPQFHLRRPRRGYFFLCGSLLALLLGLVNFGSLGGSLLLGLVFSLHAGSIADALTPPGCRVRESIGIGVSSYLLLAAFLYVPAMWLLGQVARPVVLQQDVRPFLQGDVLLSRTAAPERGRIVLYRRETMQLQYSRNAYLYITGLGIERVLALPGDVISSKKGLLSVNGVPTADRPLNPVALPDFSLTVPAGEVFLWPSVVRELPRSEYWSRAVLVPVENIDGTVVWQTHPLTRFGPVH